MLALMDARELSGWQALMRVHHDDAEYEAERAREAASSNDGEVVRLNAPPRPGDDGNDDEDEIPDGPAEQ